MLELDVQRVDPGHAGIRMIARILGPLMVVAGVIFIIVGMVSFFSAMGPGFGPPKYFWCCFVGMPLTGLGAGLTQFGYLGWFARYVANETAPVQKDTFNYLARGVRPGVKDLAQAVREGLTEDSAGDAESPRKFCSSCGHAVALDANFCSGCGQKL